MSQVHKALSAALNDLYVALNKALYKFNHAFNKLQKAVYKALRELSKALNKTLNEDLNELRQILHKLNKAFVHLRHIFRRQYQYDGGAACQLDARLVGEGRAHARRSRGRRGPRGRGWDHPTPLRGARLGVPAPGQEGPAN